jgi:hypothetical protein
MPPGKFIITVQREEGLSILLQHTPIITSFIAYALLETVAPLYPSFIYPDYRSAETVAMRYREATKDPAITRVQIIPYPNGSDQATVGTHGCASDAPNASPPSPCMGRGSGGGVGGEVSLDAHLAALAEKEQTIADLTTSTQSTMAEFLKLRDSCQALKQSLSIANAAIAQMQALNRPFVKPIPQVQIEILAHRLRLERKSTLFEARDAIQLMRNSGWSIIHMSVNPVEGELILTTVLEKLVQESFGMPISALSTAIPTALPIPVN